MALTDAERKLLDELEATLTAQDPKLVSKFTRPQHRIQPSKAVGGVLGFLIGLACLIAGMSSYWWISVIGFIIMLASAILVTSAWSRMTSRPIPQAESTPPRESFMDRMEKRWQDRLEQ